MRRIGTLNTEQEARRFADYLFSLDIRTRVDAGGDHWDVWGLDEDRVPQARNEFEEFKAEPEAEKYVAATRAAQQKREEELRTVIAAQKRQVNLRDRWNRPLFRQLPVTIALIAGSIAVTLMCRFGDNDELTAQFQIQHSTTELEPNGRGWIRYNRRMFNEVLEGQVWRLITPIFLHFSAWHLLGNMYWTAVFGGMIERRKGSVGLLWRVLLLAVTSNVAQYLVGTWTDGAGMTFGGMSGVGYGLFGYVWIKGLFDPDDGLGTARETAVFFLVWMVLCSTGLVGPIANTAHTVGLIGGILLASPAPLKRWLR